MTARGAGYGYVGGCVPSRGGVALSLARMNRVLELDTRDFVAVVQPGVITGDLQAAARARGLFYPPDPASLKNSTLGGNIATNAGGPRCLKYGVTRQYVLGLEVVLATGEVVRCGGRTHKNKTGFDLVGLFVGSEGLLGVVTEATLRLLPMPPTRAAISCGFIDMTAAAAAVQAIFAAGWLPAALEIADRFTLEAARELPGRGPRPGRRRPSVGRTRRTRIFPARRDRRITRRSCSARVRSRRRPRSATRVARRCGNCAASSASRSNPPGSSSSTKTWSYRAGGWWT